MKILKHPNFITVISVSVIIISLLIVFNFVSILNQAQNPEKYLRQEKNQEKQITMPRPTTTALVIEEPIAKTSTEELKNKFYTNKSYYMFYFIIASIVILISMTIKNLKKEFIKKLIKD